VKVFSLEKGGDLVVVLLDEVNNTKKNIGNHEHSIEHRKQ
jgi:hypothetical protein